MLVLFRVRLERVWEDVMGFTVLEIAVRHEDDEGRMIIPTWCMRIDDSQWVSCEVVLERILEVMDDTRGQDKKADRCVPEID